MMEFKSLDSIQVRGKTVFMVFNPVTCKEFDYLMKQTVLIDGECYKIVGVERRAHNGLHYEGEPIGLMVEPIK